MLFGLGLNQMIELEFSAEEFEWLKSELNHDGFSMREVTRRAVGPEEVVSGGARGVDRLGERYGREHGLIVTVMKADWEQHGGRAGFLRNGDMALYGDCLVAVWDGVSRGTRNMIAHMRSLNKPYYVLDTREVVR